MKRKFKVAIVGNGKLAKALIVGFLLAGFQPSDIVVIRREDSPSDFVWFENQGIFVSADMHNIAYAQSIILAVLPHGAGNILSRMSRVVGDDHCYEIISFISGLTLDEIKRSNLLIRKYRLVRGTCNTNVSFGRGIICLDKGCLLFPPVENTIIDYDGYGIAILSKKKNRYRSHIGTIIYGPTDRMHFATVSVGSAPAIVYKRIFTSYSALAASGGHNYRSLYLWLVGLNMQLEKFSFKTEIEENSEYASIFSFIKRQASVLRSHAFQYNAIAARDLSLLQVQSCVKSLVDIGPGVSLSDIEKLIKRIATENGSTEKGLKKIGSFEDESIEILQDAFEGMLERSRTFKFDVDVSIEKEKVLWF